MASVQFQQNFTSNFPQVLPLARLLVTNEAPSEQEASEIRSLISELDATYPTGAASPPSERMNTLNGVRVLLNTYKAVLSPLRRLPVEVLEEMFVACLPGERFIAPHFAIRLCGVCSGWRRAALSMQRLWCSLSISSYEQHVALTELWLHRSGTERPLSLSIEINDQGTPDVVDILRSHLHRWQHLSISAAAHHHGKMLSILASNVPLLETFVLGQTSELSIGAAVSVAVKNAPRLHTFTWTYAGYERQGLGLPWEQLRHLTLNLRLTGGDGLNILKLCLNLETCKFGCMRPPDHTAHANPHPQQHSHSKDFVSLRRLHTLDIIGTCSLHAIFSALTLPSLRTLTLEEPEVRPVTFAWPIADLMSLLSRSSCPIQDLIFANAAPPEPQLIECLRQVSNSLRTFAIITMDDSRAHEMVVGDHLLQLLTRKSDGDVVSGRRNEELLALPKLGLIYLRGCIHAEDGVFADMVASRMHADVNKQQEVALHTVMVGFGSHHEEDIRRLKEIRVENFTLKIYPESKQRHW